MKKPMDRRIVVGVDGSDTSITALREATRIGTAIGARIDIVCCWVAPRVNDASYVFGPVDYKAEAQELLSGSIGEAFGENMPHNVSARLINGDARQSLIETSEDAEMLVLGQRGHGGFIGLLLGSVSLACVTHAHCPVLVVRNSDRAAS